MNLFAYGSLMDGDIMERVSGCRPDALPATLADYKRFSVQGQWFPALAPLKGAVVQGVCYLDVPPSAWTGLDFFEGDMYERISVETVTSDGARLPALTYLCKVSFRGLLDQRDWSFEEFLKTGKAKFIKEYCGFVR